MLLFVLGQILFFRAFKFFEPQIDGIVFQIVEHKSIVTTSTFFSFLLFLIPVSIAFTWQLSHVISFNKKLASTLLILACIAAGIIARHQQVKTYFTKVVKPALLTDGKTNIVYPIDPVNFVYYMLAGLIIGCIFAFVFFRQRKEFRLSTFK